MPKMISCEMILLGAAKRSSLVKTLKGTIFSANSSAGRIRIRVSRLWRSHASEVQHLERPFVSNLIVLLHFWCVGE